MLQVEKGEEAGKAMVLVNPALKDIPSHSGIMGVRCAVDNPHQTAARLCLARLPHTLEHMRLPMNQTNL